MSQGMGLMKETYFLRQLKRQNLRHLANYVGEPFFSGGKILMLEFVDYSIDEYLARKDIPNKIGL